MNMPMNDRTAFTSSAMLFTSPVVFSTVPVPLVRMSLPESMTLPALSSLSFSRSNVPLLKAKDEVKFVLASRGDYEWARDVVRTHTLPGPVLFSPVWGKIEPRALVEWIREDQLPVRFQLQLHKVVWPPDARGV